MNKNTIGYWPFKLAGYLQRMVYLDTQLGIYPDYDKLNRMVAIPKLNAANLSLITARRMLSVPSFFASLRGKIISKNFLKHLESHDHLDEYQHGFRTKHSTSTALAEILCDHFGNPNKNHSELILFDARNAFGTISHKLIKEKLSTLCSSEMSRYFASELTGRTGIVTQNGKEGKLIHLNDVGVPQGSTSAPLMFNLVASGLHEKFQNDPYTKITCFADDICILISRPTMHLAQQAAVKVVQEVAKWAESRGMSLNFPKCAHLAIGESKHENLKIDQTNMIKGVNTINYLRFRFDAKLNFTAQWQHKIIRIKQARGLINNIRLAGSQYDALKVAHSVVYGHLNYGIEVLPTPSKSIYSRVVHAIQEVIIDIFGLPLFREKKHSTEKLFKMANWPHPIHVHEKAKLTFFHTIIVNRKPAALFDFLARHIFGALIITPLDVI